MIIQLYDESGIDGDGGYPLIEIENDGLYQFKKDLDKYRKGNDEYNVDDFLLVLKDKLYYIGTHSVDKEIYF